MNNTFMIKELKESSIMVNKILELDDFFINSIIDLFKNNKVIFTGMGSSFFISEIGEYFFKNICLLDNIFSCSADEICNKYSFINQNYIIFTFSQSGNTIEVLELLKKYNNIKSYSFTSNSNGEHLKLSNNNYIFDIGLEKSPVSTKYVIYSILLLYRISTNYSGIYKSNDFVKFKKFSDNVFSLYFNKIEQLTNLYKLSNNFIIIGNGINYFIAKEISLKIRETIGINTSYDNVGQLNHGGINSINTNTICILLEEDINIINKIKLRGGNIIIVGKSIYSDIKFEGINDYIDIIQKIILLDYFIHTLAMKLNINTDKKLW